MNYLEKRRKEVSDELSQLLLKLMKEKHPEYYAHWDGIIILNNEKA